MNPPQASGRIFQGLRVYLPAVSQGQIFLWKMYAGFKHLRRAESTLRSIKTVCR